MAKLTIPENLKPQAKLKYIDKGGKNLREKKKSSISVMTSRKYWTSSTANARKAQEAHFKLNLRPKKGRNATLLHATNTTVPTNGRIVQKIGTIIITIPLLMTLPLLSMLHRLRSKSARGEEEHGGR